MGESSIRMFRLNGYDNISEETFQLYLKIYLSDDNGNDAILCNYCIDEYGCSYYKPGSRILTPRENEETRNSIDGFLSMKKLKELFEALKSASLFDEEYDDSEFKFTVDDGKVIISKP